MRRGRLIGWAGLLASATLIAWCYQSSDGELDTGEIADLSKLTRPPGAAYFPGSRPVRRQWSVEASWELETDMDWPSYRKWVREQLDGYDARSDGERSLVFRRSIPGDTYMLAIEAVSLGPPLRVQLSFNASPD